MMARAWATISEQPLSEEVLRLKFPIAEGYWVSRGGCDAHASYSASVGVTMTIYLLEGRCSYSSERGSVTVSEGEFADIPPGWYVVTADEEPVRLVKVFHLPDEVRKIL